MSYRSVGRRTSVWVQYTLLLTSGVAWAQSQRDQVCQGSCGGGCGACPSSSSGSSYSRSSESNQEEARQESARRARIRLAHEQNDEGLAAWNGGNWAAAVDAFEKASQNSPNDPVIKTNLAGARQMLEKQRGDQLAAQNMKELVQGLKLVPAKATDNLTFSGFAANKPKSAPPEDVGLDMGSFAPASNARVAEPTQAPPELSLPSGTGRSAFGTTVARPQLPPKAPSTASGTNTKAGDQLLSMAAAAASPGKDLTPNYDAGTGTSHGSLQYARSPSMDLSTFSEAARKDPRIVAGIKDVEALLLKRQQLKRDRDELIAQRNAASNDAGMKVLDDLVLNKDKEVQATVILIVNKEQAVEKLHREIDVRVAKGSASPTGQK